MSATLIGTVISGILLVIILIWFVTTYNRLVRLRENVNKSWADIDVLLKQRYDMLPNLVNTVKGYATHEKEIFEEFAKARQMAAGALANGDMKTLGQAEGMLSGILPKINVVAEQYPELKANENFMNLQKEIVSMENQIADRREFFNSSATNWNAAIQMIPANIVASFMKAERRDLFEVVNPVERETVKIEF